MFRHSKIFYVTSKGAARHELRSGDLVDYSGTCITVGFCFRFKYCLCNFFSSFLEFLCFHDEELLFNFFFFENGWLVILFFHHKGLFFLNFIFETTERGLLFSQGIQNPPFCFGSDLRLGGGYQTGTADALYSTNLARRRSTIWKKTFVLL